MAKPDQIELPTGETFRVLYEDRSVIAIDKPVGWMLAPPSWLKTGRNLQAALASSVAAGDFWARSRNLRFIRFIHRIDAETTGIVLFARSAGAVRAYSELFESRRMEKVYLAAVTGIPPRNEWTCHAKLAPDPRRRGRMKVDPRTGKNAETGFRLLQATGNRALIEVHPFTGRTHQIRVHLAESGCPVLGDELYGEEFGGSELALRAVKLAYRDPFSRRDVCIRAPSEAFCRSFGFSAAIAS